MSYRPLVYNGPNGPIRTLRASRALQPTRIGGLRPLASHSRGLTSLVGFWLHLYGLDDLTATKPIKMQSETHKGCQTSAMCSNMTGQTMEFLTLGLFWSLDGVEIRYEALISSDYRTTLRWNLQFMWQNKSDKIDIFYVLFKKWLFWLISGQIWSIFFYSGA